MKNSTLGIITVILLVLSIFSYRQSVTRAERFERGQKFLPQLNPDAIAEIEISKGDENIVLRRGEDNFSVATKNGYPAKNETVNRFLKDLLEISLEREVGRSESLQAELDLVEGQGEVATYLLKDNSGNTLVNFAVGKASEDGRGNFVRRLEGEDRMIHLTSRGVYLSTTEDSFLDKDLLDVKAEAISRIEGTGFVFAKGEDGQLSLQDIPDGKQANTEANQVTSALSFLRFDKVYLADEPEVSGLNFAKRTRFSLDDQSGYVVSVAQKEDKHYLRVEGTFEVSSIQVEEEETEEDLQAKSEILRRGNEIAEFNEFHGSWVYEVTEITAKKFGHTKDSLIEDVEQEEAEEGE